MLICRARHPFQQKSLKWLLRREGKQVAGRDENGEHYVGDIEDEEYIENESRIFWMPFELDDYSAWLNVVTCQVSETKPEVAVDEEVFEGSILAEEMGKDALKDLQQR